MSARIATVTGMTEGTETQAQRDAHIAWSYAASCVLLEERAPRMGRTADAVIADYATDLGDQLGGDRDRLLAAARVACIAAAEEVAYPGRWRSAIRAVELCQRAAGLNREERV